MARKPPATLTDTGVIIYRTTQIESWMNANVHYWLEWNGGTTDANALGDRVVSRPALYTPTQHTKTNQKLDECEYDFDKLHQCISEEVEKYLRQRFGLCYAWTDHLWNTCKSKSKRR
jgi:hypothetical protein